MPRIPRPYPVTLTDGWPDRPIGMPEGEAARLLALALREQMDDRSATEVARLCGLAPATVCAVLNGTSWVDMRTIVQLEIGLGVRLWPAFDARSTAQE